ncbi:MAG: HEAT repeat domain-containing protein [Myxococcota bacterium]
MKLFGAGVLGTLTLLSLGYWWLGAEGPAPEAPAKAVGIRTEAEKPLNCGYEMGRELAFRFESEARARDGEGRMAPGRDVFSGILSLRVVLHDGLQATMEAGLSEVELDQPLTKAEEKVSEDLNTGFRLEASAKDCRLLGFELPETWSAPARRLVAGMLRSHEFVLGSGPSWEVEQVDAVGSHRARYIRRGPTLERRKLHYTMTGLDVFGLELQLAEAAARARFGPEGLEEVRGREVLNIVMRQQLQVVLELSMAWQRDDGRFVAPRLGSALASVDPFATENSEAYGLPEAPSELEQARLRFEASMGFLEGMTVRQARTLAGLLAAHPELIPVLVERILAAGLSDKQRASAFWSLELAATPQARKALQGLLLAPDPNDRIRAAIAYSGAGKATVEVGRRLLEVHAQDAAPEVAAAGLMALGSLGSEGSPELKAFVQKSLQTALDGAETGYETMSALDAIGNSADPAFLPEVTERLLDPSEHVRIRSAHALRGMGPEAIDALRDAMESEAKEEPAIAMVRALAEIGAPDATSVTWAERQLEHPLKSVRAELIEWLGASSLPEAKGVLARHFHREPSGQLKQQIGRFLPASALVR